MFIEKITYLKEGLGNKKWQEEVGRILPNTGLQTIIKGLFMYVASRLNNNIPIKEVSTVRNVHFVKVLMTHLLFKPKDGI